MESFALLYMMAGTEDIVRFFVSNARQLMGMDKIVFNLNIIRSILFGVIYY